MLEDLREYTFNGIKHLTREQLFQVPEVGEFPIGAYLMHLAEVDIYWLEILSGIKQSDELKKRAYSDAWYDTKNPAPPDKPLENNEYYDVLRLTRKNFLDYISTLDDKELNTELTMRWGSGDKSIPRKWIIYHILEHEAHHRGQMFLLIRKAGWNKVES